MADPHGRAFPTLVVFLAYYSVTVAELSGIPEPTWLYIICPRCVGLRAGGYILIATSSSSGHEERTGRVGSKLEDRAVNFGDW